MKNLVLNQKTRNILTFLTAHPEGSYTSILSRASGIQLNALYNRLLRLKDQEYVDKKARLWYVTAKGTAWLTNNLTLSSSLTTPSVKLSTPPSQPKPPIQTRAHKLGYAYTLLDPLPPKTPDKLMHQSFKEAKSIVLHNNTQALARIGSLTIKLTTKSLIIFSKDIYTDNQTPTIALEADLKPLFDQQAEEYANRLNIRLKHIKKGILESQTISQHYAHEHHPASEVSKESNLILARSLLDGQKRLGIDESKGFRELEYYHRLTAGRDKDTLDPQFNALLDGEISLFDIERMKTMLGEMANTLKGTQDYIMDREKQDMAFRRDVALHLKIMHKIDQKLSQRKLSPQSLSQIHGQV